MEKFMDNVIGSSGGVMLYRLGYLLIFLGRITIPIAFALSITLLRRGGPGKAMGPELLFAC